MRYEDRAVRLLRGPLDWRAHAFVLGGVLGLPLVCLPPAAALVHFILEERFNQALRFDLVKRPAIRRLASIVYHSRGRRAAARRTAAGLRGLRPFVADSSPLLRFSVTEA